MFLEIVIAALLFLKNISQEKDIFSASVLQNPSSWQLVTKDASWSERDAHTLASFNGKIWLIGGVGGVAPDYSKNQSDIWNSENGKEWNLVLSKAPWGEKRAHQSLVFKEKLWVMGGVGKGEVYKNDVWSSEDGINWTLIKAKAEWPERKGFSAVVFKDKIWVIGGVTNQGVVNDVWYSEDGENWKLAVKEAAWSPRYDLAVEAFNGKLWLVGGVAPGEMAETDIWSSEDGINWNLVSEKSVFPARHGHCLLEYNNSLWILGGWSGYYKSYHDVWFSSDGKNWEKIGEAPWTGREDLTCSVFKDSIFVAGGMQSSGVRTNDVWYFK